MGDRAVVVFSQHDEDVAAVYLHWGGSEADEILERFFDAEDANDARDNRFGDPEYLAARFVAARVDGRGMGIGIVPVTAREHSNWRVHCDGDQHPRVESID